MIVDYQGNNVESGNLLKINTETKQYAKANFKNDEMFEEDESDKIERVNLELGQEDIVSQTAWDAED